MTKLTISDAKKLASTLAADGVAIFVFRQDQVASASYGADKHLCESMAKFIDRVVDDLESGDIDNPLDHGGCPWPRITQE